MLDYSQARTFSVQAIWKGKMTPIEVQFVPLVEETKEAERGRFLVIPEGDETHWILQGWSHGPQATFEWQSTDEKIFRILSCALSEPQLEHFFLDRCFELPVGDDGKTFYLIFRGTKFPVRPFELVSEEVGFLTGEERLHLPAPSKEFFGWSNSQLEQWIDVQLQNPTSEINLILWWDRLDYKERNGFLQGKFGSLDELRRVMVWVLFRDPTFDQGFRFWSLVDDVLWVNRTGSAGVEVTLTPYLARWRDFLTSWFAPLERLEMDVIPHCVTEHLDRMSLLSARLEAPTAHERLEATLNLRAWLEQNATPEEFEAIWAITPV